MLSVPETSPSENSKRLCCLRKSTRLPEYAPEVRAELTTYSVYPCKLNGTLDGTWSAFLGSSPEIRGMLGKVYGIYSEKIAGYFPLFSTQLPREVRSAFIKSCNFTRVILLG